MICMAAKVALAPADAIVAVTIRIIAIEADFLRSRATERWFLE
jgi:hypothetical protein